MYTYDQDFFDFVDVSSGKSAAAFLTAFCQNFMPQSVLDVGCGRGVWLHEWHNLGVQDVVGVDGDYVQPQTLKILSDQFVARNISVPFDLGRVFDLVQCLEVAEHIPEADSDTLLRNLVTHGNTILFSAAQPGQGGEFHVNEQPLGYWIEKFRGYAYEPFDYPRAAVQGIIVIEPWYRYNTLIFANTAGLQNLSSAIISTKIQGNNPGNYASISWRIRCRVLSVLPATLIHRLARLKHQAIKKITQLKN
jgi:SAM-dependent methyltransferase